jgi:hypothetical protein
LSCLLPVLSEHELAAIGSVCSAWAHVEILLGDTITLLHQKLAGANPPVSILRLPVPQKLNLIQKLAKEKLDERDRAAFRNLCDQVYQLSKERNVVIHADWFPEEPEGTSESESQSSVGVLCSRYGECTTCSILQLSKNISETGDRLNRLLFANGISPTWEKPNSPDFDRSQFDEDWNWIGLYG